MTITTNFKETGTTLFKLQNTPFSPEEINFIKEKVFDIPREQICVGDTGEDHRLSVGRLMVDVEKPVVVNHDQSNEVLAILSSEKVRKWVESTTNHKGKLRLRRCALNYMEQGHYVSSHNDGRTNPDYLYFVSMHLNKAFTGGEFFSTHYQNSNVIEFPCEDDLCISRCNLPHGVKTVTSGLRATLIWFYADESAGEFNRRNYHSDPLPEKSAAAQGFSGLLNS